MGYRWYRHSWKNDWYVVAHIHKNGRTDAHISLHRLIINPPSDKTIDHIYPDRLDNRKRNLRVVDHCQNQWNRNAPNVRRRKDCARWETSIRVRGVRHHLGTFRTREEAEMRYWNAAAELRGVEFIPKGLVQS